MQNKTVRPISAVRESHPDFEPGWRARGPSTPLASEVYGAVHHVAVCDSAGRPLWDQMMHAEPGGAVVIPVCADGRLVLVEVDRPLLQPRGETSNTAGLEMEHVGRTSLEFPRGFGIPGETPEQTASRELIEETGLAVVEPRCIGYLYPNTAFSSTAIAVVTARVAGVPSAGIEVERVLAMRDDELDEAVAAGRISCGITLSALSFARADRVARDDAATHALVESVARALEPPDVRRAVLRLEGDALDSVMALASVPVDLRLPAALERELAAVASAAKALLEARSADIGIAAARSHLSRAAERLAQRLREHDASGVLFAPPLAALEDAVERIRTGHDAPSSGDGGAHLLVTLCAAALSDAMSRVCAQPRDISVSIVLARASDGEEGAIAARVWSPEGPVSTFARQGRPPNQRPLETSASRSTGDSQPGGDAHVAVVLNPANRDRVDSVAALLGVAPPCVVFLRAPLQVLEEPMLSRAQRRFVTQTCVPLTLNGVEGQVETAYRQLIYGRRAATNLAWQTLEASVPACRLLLPIARLTLGLGALDSSLNGLHRLSELLGGGD